MTAGRIVAQKYRLEGVLGRGGLGEVWAATELDSARKLAVKFVRGDAQMNVRRRLHIEARALSQLEHPNCVQVIDFGFELGEPYLVMELVPGRALRAALDGPPPIAQVLDIATQLCAALEHAHSRGITHRDLKPDNVMLVPQASGELVKVLDFGIARLSGREQGDITKTGEAIGTAAYMSPEQLRGQRDVGPSTDLYALGVILFEMIEGRLPFRGASPLELGMKHLTQPPPPISRSDCPDELKITVARLLEKSPKDRFATARQVADALVGSDGPRLVVTSAAGRSGGLIVAGALVLAAVAAVALSQRSAGNDVETTAPGQSLEVRSSALLKTPDAAPGGASEDADAVVRDMGGSAPDRGEAALPFDRFTTGCGKKPLSVDLLPPGVSSRDALLTVTLPRSYDKRKPYPVLLMFHDVFQTPHRLRKESEIRKVADAEGFVVLSPRGGTSTLWADIETDVSTGLRATVLAGEHYCLDRQRVYAVGFGRGARIVEALPCAMPELAGIATVSNRSKAQLLCEPEPPVPYMHVTGLQDRLFPPEGGESCVGLHTISIEQHESLWRAQNNCDDERSLFLEEDDATCYQWNCEQEFVSCHLDAGRGWRLSSPTKLHQLQGCASPPPKFDIAAAMWKFFSGTARYRELTSTATSALKAR